MKISQRQSGGITILDLQGKIMFGDGDEELRAAVDEVIESGEVKLILNMAEVSYVDSAGLSELVRSYVSAHKRLGRLVLLDLTRKVEDLLVMTKLLKVFDPFESEEAAVRSFASPPAQ